MNFLRALAFAAAVDAVNTVARFGSWLLDTQLDQHITRWANETGDES